MHLAPMPTQTAPQATGHPQGLPEIRATHVPKAIPPTTASGRAAVSSEQRHTPVPMSKSKRELPDPATHIAPPSIMQIKISNMLAEQTVQEGDEKHDDTDAVSADKVNPIDAPFETAKDPDTPDADETRPSGAEATYLEVLSLSRNSVFKTLP